MTSSTKSRLSIPAQLTSPSAGPRAASTSSTARRHSPGSARSAATQCVRPATVLAARSNRSRLVATSPTWAPNSAKRCATASPMPRETPVTITTRPEYELITRRYLARAAKFRRDYKHGPPRARQPDATMKPAIVGSKPPRRTATERNPPVSLDLPPPTLKPRSGLDNGLPKHAVLQATLHNDHYRAQF